MKKIQCFALMLVLAYVFTSGASAVQLNCNGNSWFFPDGRIVQTLRVVTEDGVEYPGILCYDSDGKQLWSHSFGKPAIGRSDCRMLDDGTIAFLYYDENHQYFMECLNPQGELVEKGTWEPYTKSGMLFEYGIVFYEKYQQNNETVLNVRHWDGREKHWALKGIDKMSLFSAATYGGRLYIEIGYQNSQKQSVHSLLSIDATGEDVWEYRVNSVLPISAYTGNEQGGITLFVQKTSANDQLELEMITLNQHGEEISFARVEGIPASMAMNVVDAQENGLYRIWGYGYENYGENAIICASLNAQGDVLERTDIPVDYATCIRYLNNDLYVMVYENGIESFELMPFEVFAESVQETK